MQDGQVTSLNVPNALTALRFVLIGVFMYVFLVMKDEMFALAVFALAALTDMLDGYIARKCDLVTDAGKLLDPLADKLMLLAALSCLVSVNAIPLFFLLIVALKEFAMIIGGIYLYRKKVVVYSKTLGKIATVMFNSGVVLTLLRQYVYPFNLILLYAAIGVAFVALLQYGISSFFTTLKAQRKAKRGNAD